jgi:hypothetical protein
METKELKKAQHLIQKSKRESFVAHQKADEDETVDEDKAAAY